MENVTHSELVGRVLAVMQEAAASDGTSSGSLIGDTTEDLRALRGHVEAALPSAVAMVQRVARGVNVVSVGSEETDESGEYSEFVAPLGYVGLYRLWLDGWERPVTEAVEEGSEMARRQYNKWTRARRDKPVVVSIPRDGGVTLRCYPAGVLSEMVVDVAYDSDAGLRSVAGYLGRAVAYVAGSLVYDGMRMGDMAQRMLSVGLRLAGGGQTGQSAGNGSLG